MALATKRDDDGYRLRRLPAGTSVSACSCLTSKEKGRDEESESWSERQISSYLSCKPVPATTSLLMVLDVDVEDQSDCRPRLRKGGGGRAE